MNEYMKHLVAARNTRALELALVIPRSRTDQFSRSFPACCCASVELATVGRV